MSAPAGLALEIVAALTIQAAAMLIALGGYLLATRRLPRCYPTMLPFVAVGDLLNTLARRRTLALLRRVNEAPRRWYGRPMRVEPSEPWPRWSPVEPFGK